MRTGARYFVAQHAGGALIDLLLASTRFDVANPAAYRQPVSAGQPVIFTLWHGHLLPLGYLHRGQGVVGLASRSADGEYIARLLQHWGFGMVRGSSSKGGDVAFRELVRTLRAGRSVAITPDGPRGPRERVKPGVLQLAQMTGAPLVPVACAASRAWWFVSWDRFLVPQPFARVCVAYADAIPVARGASASDVAALTAHVEAILDELSKRVAAGCAYTGLRARGWPFR